MAEELSQTFGAIDIYVFDQLLRGRITPGMEVFDAGCGRGRNLEYFLRAGYSVRGVDRDPDAIAALRARAAELRPDLPADRFRAAELETLSEGPPAGDVVICNAVLHFARDHDHFDAMLAGVWSAVRPGGVFFARLASSIGMESRFEELGAGRFRLLDGSERYLVDAARLAALSTQLGTLLDPLKTTIVQDQRCMTTWVLRKPV